MLTAPAALYQPIAPAARSVCRMRAYPASLVFATGQAVEYCGQTIAGDDVAAQIDWGAALDATARPEQTRSSDGRRMGQPFYSMHCFATSSKNRPPHPASIKTTMNSNQINEISKFLSYVLRHEPQSIGLHLDTEGWAEIDLLIIGAAKEGRILDQGLILETVNSSDKRRFAISNDSQYIRAVQGHSTKSVNLQHIEKEPPEFLYHGTATRFLDSIRLKGLIAGSRRHVHLSKDTTTAASVGQRHGKPVILKIEALLMYQQGFKFFQAENGVWLTDHIPSNQIIEEDH